MEFLERHESALLLGAVACYFGAMLALWAQVFGRDEAARQRETWHRRAALLGIRALALGAILHALSLLGQGGDLFGVRVGVAGLFGWILALSYLFFGRRIGRETLGAFVSPVVFLAALYSLAAPSLHRAARAETLETQWLVVHVVIILLGYVALAFAFASSLLYLLQEGLLKRKKLAGLWQRLPSLQVADELIFRATLFGVALLALGIVTGVAWQQRHQGDYVALRDPKVLFTLATWLTFAIYLGARTRLGWRGRRTNLVVVYGFVLLVISFFGAPHVLPGIAR